MVDTGMNIHSSRVFICEWQALTGAPRIKMVIFGSTNRGPHQWGIECLFKNQFLVVFLRAQHWPSSQKAGGSLGDACGRSVWECKMICDLYTRQTYSRALYTHLTLFLSDAIIWSPYVPSSSAWNQQSLDQTQFADVAQHIRGVGDEFFRKNDPKCFEVEARRKLTGRMLMDMTGHRWVGL